MKNLVTICLIITITVVVLGCNKGTEQEKVKKVIAVIQTAAEEKDVRKIINSLEETYNDSQGFNRDTIKALLVGYFLRNPKISVYISNLEISVDNTSAKAAFQAVLTSGNRTGSVTDVIPRSLGVYRFDVSMNRTSDGWKVTSARWERVGNDEHGEN